MSTNTELNTQESLKQLTVQVNKIHSKVSMLELAVSDLKNGNKKLREGYAHMLRILADQARGTSDK